MLRVQFEAIFDKLLYQILCFHIKSGLVLFPHSGR